MSHLDPAAKWARKQELLDGGWSMANERAIKVHNPNETEKHLALKAMLALLLERRGRVWSTEEKLEGEKGRADVMDWGPKDGRAVVYEVETDATKAKAREKASQYAGGAVRDVIVLDTRDAPDEPAEMLVWLEEQVI